MYATRSFPVTPFHLIAPCLLSAVLLTGCDIQINGGYTFNRTGETATEDDGGELAENVTSIHVENKFGNVKVSRVSEGETPSWKWNGKVWGDSQELADALIEQLVLEVKTEGDQQTFTLLMPDSQSGFNGCESILELKISAESSIDVTNEHGDLEIADVGQDAKLSGSFGNLQVKNVEGNLTLISKHSDVRIDGVQGETDAEASFGEMTVDGIQGPAKLENAHGSIEGTLHGPAEVESSFDKIKLTYDGSSIEVKNKHGDTDLTMATQDFKTIDIENKHGDVSIQLPPGTSATVNMDSSFGDAKSKVSNDDPGDRKITVKNSHGDIEIE